MTTPLNVHEIVEHDKQLRWTVWDGGASWPRTVATITKRGEDIIFDPPFDSPEFTAAVNEATEAQRQEHRRDIISEFRASRNPLTRLLARLVR